jgi:hypothetical protein
MEEFIAQEVDMERSQLLVFLDDKHELTSFLEEYHFKRFEGGIILADVDGGE